MGFDFLNTQELVKIFVIAFLVALFFFGIQYITSPKRQVVVEDNERVGEEPVNDGTDNLSEATGTGDTDGAYGSGDDKERAPGPLTEIKTVETNPPEISDPFISDKEFGDPLVFTNLLKKESQGETFLQMKGKGTATYENSFNILESRNLEYITIRYSKEDTYISSFLQLHITINNRETGESNQYNIHLGSYPTESEVREVGVNMSEYGIELNQNIQIGTKAYFGLKGGDSPKLYEYSLYS